MAAGIVEAKNRATPYYYFATMAADYAHAASHLDRARMPAYVSFVERTLARGIGGAQTDDQRIYVRMSDGKIVSAVPPAYSSVVRTENADSSNPFRDGGFLNPNFYVPKNETETRWNGQPALRFELQATCPNGNGITELYADPKTFQPIAVDGDSPYPEEHVIAAARAILRRPQQSRQPRLKTKIVAFVAKMQLCVKIVRSSKKRRRSLRKSPDEVRIHRGAKNAAQRETDVPPSQRFACRILRMATETAKRKGGCGRGAFG